MTDTLLIFHFIGLMLGAGGGLGSTVVMGYARSLPTEQAEPVRAVGPTLARMSTVGLVLMLLTGVALIAFKYGGFDAMPLMFWIKLVFAGTLTLAVILIEVTYARMAKGNAKAAEMLPRFGPVAGISALAAVVFAALAFH
ncbi:MAG: hypothetical protein Q8R02_05210 [Hyphomonadaceae bacterium]|nr:hypothetical protein [Hyphomonadaceae bacterium]